MKAPRRGVVLRPSMKAPRVVLRPSMKAPRVVLRPSKKAPPRGLKTTDKPTKGEDRADESVIKKG